MRAVFGHLAAQGVERYKKGPKTDEFRDWFLDESAPLPEGIYFYYWPFPHQGSVVFRDAAILDLNTQRTNVIWLMKFFPIAFLVAWEDAHQPMFTLPRLCQLPSANLEEAVDIPIYLTNIPHKYWPEAPTDRTVVLYGQEAMFAVPHIKKVPRYG